MSVIEDTKIIQNMSMTKQRIRQNYLLIWVDEDIDENNDFYRSALIEIRKIVETVKICHRSEQCKEYLNAMDEDKAFVLLSATLSQHLVPEIVEISKLDSIYILGGNRAKVEEWASEWSKIEGIFSSIQPVYHSLNKVVRGCDYDSIPMSFVSKQMMEIQTLDENNNN